MSSRPTRILFYSHDTFGLGHIRRTRALANAIVGSGTDISVLILSGSPLVGSFHFGEGIDFVHIPSVTKTRTGAYSSANLRMDIREVVDLRRAIIYEATRAFKPDVFIADKEPTGFQGELLPTLELLSNTGCRIVLGIRDVLDDPETVLAEWTARGAVEAVSDFYDDIFVYGLERFFRPLDGVPLPDRIARKITYTGYLRRTVPGGPPAVRYPKIAKGPFILVATGGGGDGASIIDLALSAYETQPKLPFPALIVTGPYLSRSHRRDVAARIERLPNVDHIAFDPKIERLINRAAGVVAMGGYNTFCEILSFDKPSIIVPREFPRKEQAIRARRAAELGLVRELRESPDRLRNVDALIHELSTLCERPRPSSVKLDNLLDGLPTVCDELMRPQVSVTQTGKALIRSL
jgi:predicted glycosyltransferase